MDIEQCVEHYADYLFHMAYMYTKDRFAAEEVVQDVFMKFYTTQQFEQRSSLKTYLTSMTIHRSHDYIRKQKIKRFVTLDYWSANSKSSEQQLIEQYEQDALIQAILQLPMKYREIVFLYYYDECKTDEIAQLLGMSASTVRTRLQRARERLKELLNPVDWEVLKDE